MSENEHAWPGVGQAQAFVLPSYQWMIARTEAADSRLQTLVAFVATVTLAMPTAASALKLTVSFGSFWFVGAMIAASIAVIIGVFFRSSGAVTLADPAILYEKWLHKDTWQFQKDAVYFAGKHFAENKARIETKSRALTWMTGLFMLELAFLLRWITA